MTSRPSRPLVIPRLTDEYLEALVTEEQYHHFPGTRTMVCCLTIQDDQTIVGVAMCAEKSRFDPMVGRKVARKKALTQLKDYEQYILRQRINEHRRNKPHDT